MTVVSISSHEVDTVAVLIPEGSLIGQGTVGDSDVVVMVVGGEWPAVVVGHRVPCTENTDSNVRDEKTNTGKRMHTRYRVIF